MFSFIHSELSQDKTVHCKSAYNINRALIGWEGRLNIWRWWRCVLCCELFASRLHQQLANTCPSSWGCYSGWTGNVLKWQQHVCSGSWTLIDGSDHFRSQGVKQMLHQLYPLFTLSVMSWGKNHVTQFSPCRLNVCSNLFISSFMLATDCK